MTPYSIPRLTAREKKRLLRAAELIEMNASNYSCLAVRGSIYTDDFVLYSDLADAYARFIQPFDDDIRGVFVEDFIGQVNQRYPNDEVKGHRVLAVLMFWAAGSAP